MRDYIKLLKSKWLTIVAITLLGALGGTAAALLIPPEYQARVTLFVSAQTSENPNAIYQGALLSRDRVTSYSELAKSSRVLNEVISSLHLPETATDLTRDIAASSSQNSVLIDVDARSQTPQEAADLANAVGQSLTRVIADLERPTDSRQPPQISVRIVQPAALPTEPSSVSGGILIALGVLTGLVVGIGWVLARNYLDTSLRSADDLKSITSKATLAVIPDDQAGVGGAPRIETDNYSRSAEAYRTLRTNLQYVDVDNPRRVLLVTSSVPGEGKTTTILHLATALAAAGSRVVLVDADLRRANVANRLGLEGEVGVTTVLSSRIAVAEALQAWKPGGFDVLVAGGTPPNPSELLASLQMRNLLAELSSSYDYVLLDSPPLLPVTDSASVAPSCDGVLLVSRHRKVNRAQLESSMESLEAVGATLLGSIYNGVPRQTAKSARYDTYYRYETSGKREESTAGIAHNENVSDLDSPLRPVPHRRGSA